MHRDTDAPAHLINIAPGEPNALEVNMALKMKVPQPDAETTPPVPAEPKAPTPEREPTAAPAEQGAVPTPEAARLAYFRAMADAKAEFGPLRKTRPIYKDKDWREQLARGQNPKVSRYFADLSDVMNCTDAALSKHGLFHRIDSERIDDGGLRYTVTMAHRDGHVETGIWELGSEDQVPGEGAVTSKMTAIQCRGVIDTYARRYSLQNFLGIAAEEDLDGQTDRGPEKPAGDPKAAAIFAGAATPAVTPQPEPTPTGSVSEPAQAPTTAVEPGPAATEPAPAASEPEPEIADPAERDLATAKRELTVMLVDQLAKAGIQNNRENILVLLDATCAQVGVTREDLNDIGTVESLIALQQVSPVDPSVLDLQPA